jgi:integrase
VAVRKRGSRWHVEFRYTDPLTGKLTRFRRTTGEGTNKREAEALERAWRQEVETVEPEAPVRKQAAFSGFAHHWCEMKAPDWKPSYARGVEQTLRVHLVPFFGDAGLRAITPEQVQRYKAKKARTHAPKSVNNQLGILGSLFTAAVKWGYADQNPAQRVDKLAVPIKELEFWVPEQSEAFLDFVRREEPRWYPLFFCALRTGLRSGELFGLQWTDVDFITRRLHIRHNWTVGQDGKGVMTTPKSGKARLVPISPELFQVLKAHRHLRGERVFSMPDGGALDTYKVKKHLARCCRRAGVVRLSMHGLRHTFASQLVMKGVPIRAVQELLGHADIQTTMRYAHLAPGATASYVAVLDAGAPEERWPQNGHKTGFREV